MSHNPEVNRHHRKLQWDTEEQAMAHVEALKASGVAHDPERLTHYPCGLKEDGVTPDHWHSGHLKKRKKG